VVPDNLKSGVHLAHRYEPELNRTYEEMGRHYGVAIIPARSAKPRDKIFERVAIDEDEIRISARLDNAEWSVPVRTSRPRERKQFGRSRGRLAEYLDRREPSAEFGKLLSLLCRK